MTGTAHVPSQTPPTLEDIEAMALDAVEALPDRFRKPAREVILRVEELAERDMLDDLRIDDPFQLTGLYDGVPLTQKSSMDQPFGPDVIWLFRRAILDEWVERGEVEIFALVSHVVVHEFAHHFGWSDDDIAVIDRWWE